MPTIQRSTCKLCEVWVGSDRSWGKETHIKISLSILVKKVLHFSLHNHHGRLEVVEQCCCRSNWSDIHSTWRAGKFRGVSDHLMSKPPGILYFNFKSAYLVLIDSMKSHTYRHLKAACLKTISSKASSSQSDFKAQLLRCLRLTLRDMKSYSAGPPGLRCSLLNL